MRPGQIGGKRRANVTVPPPSLRLAAGCIGVAHRYHREGFDTDTTREIAGGLAFDSNKPG